MQHAQLQNRAFYFRPKCDVIWLNIDVTDDPEELQSQYGHGLKEIETALVEEAE